MVENELGDNSKVVRRTKVQQTLRLENASVWAFDFADQLVLPWIDTVMYSVALAAGSDFVQHAAVEPDGTKVLIRTSAHVTATITVEVAQCVYQ